VAHQGSDIGSTSSVYGNSIDGNASCTAMLLKSVVHAAHPPFQLLPQPRGAISNLTPSPVGMKKVAAGDVILGVKAVGINFR
jgi:hypothetical protein